VGYAALTYPLRSEKYIANRQDAKVTKKKVLIVEKSWRSWRSWRLGGSA
jgi:hypothetical protein